MGSGRSVDGVRAEGGVSDRARPVVVLLDGGVVECFTRGVLRVPERGRLAVLEADHVVFPAVIVRAYVNEHEGNGGLRTVPVAHVIAEFFLEDGLTPVVGVEI